MALTVDQKLLKRTKFPPEFDEKVDMRKVNLDVMKKWIGGKIQDILKQEDEVLVELVCNLLDPTKTPSPFPKIKEIQIQLTGFLDREVATFCKELWQMCISAQSSPQGVPKELLEAKKLEMIQEKVLASIHCREPC
ncbi:PWI domain-containing protein [Pseudovirgaria hyperparasitica]|uniref:PWI domain-containing protein n=1 Tax=Pseudovirgaria hyperparasitica TaxID=470096 RepID=A0A6A6W195_9PEZI|nr:PWI domain-containing protein [Pseudovirgaria hyperparasitica]KAF2756682.1 PWI domain-containing protein [Pseudovirgaria hyperparasitica]